MMVGRELSEDEYMSSRKEQTVLAVKNLRPDKFKDISLPWKTKSKS